MAGTGKPLTNQHLADPRSSVQDLLSKVSRYEALFELADAINTAADIESVGMVLAHRLKFIADVYSWRYVCADDDPDTTGKGQPPVIVVDGYRGNAEVTRTRYRALSALELELWHDRKSGILSGDRMRAVAAQLPAKLRKDDLEQISVNTLVEGGSTRALYLYCKRRSPFSDLDVKYLPLVCGFFHRKIRMLWEQQKLRDLETAYLEQDIMLRQSERLATLGRLSAGMAHEINNPASAVRQGTEQLKASLAATVQALLEIGAADLSVTQRDLLAGLEDRARELAGNSAELDPVTRSDREQVVEERLAGQGIDAPWQHAPTLVAMGLPIDDLDALGRSFGTSLMPAVLAYFGGRFTAHRLLGEIGRGGRRITEIVNALKGYAFMDQGPVQAVDINRGLHETLVMLNSKLSGGIRVVLDLAKDPPRVQGHGSELNQVWTNLLDNALGVMNGAGTLELKTYREHDWIVVEVADTGPGIPVEAQKKVFDPFYTTKPPGEGTGLGLTISHNIIVAKHKGRISVDSKPGNTRFTVRLPVTGSASVPAGQGTEP